MPKQITKLDVILKVSPESKQEVKDLFKEIINSSSRDYDGAVICPTKALLDKVDEL